MSEVASSRLLDISSNLANACAMKSSLMIRLRSCSEVTSSSLILNVCSKGPNSSLTRYLLFQWKIVILHSGWGISPTTRISPKITQRRKERKGLQVARCLTKWDYEDYLCPLVSAVESNSIILFDGVCNLCNGSVQFVIRRDPKGVFRFAALQSSEGQELMRQHGLDTSALYSIIVVSGGKVWQRSRAALEIVRRLSGLWPLLYGFIIVPPFIRDWFYDRIAANRYKWFGKQDECMIPTPELRARFL